MPEALYRKYRPSKFSEVIGQEPIVQALEGALAAHQTTHAYLFTGSRGTGKTSVARILARALGCSPEDLVELDAASNTGVDDVRELQEGVRTLPFSGPVKVYIIDEIHMLSKSAFNALLKTLEEPPAHVVFILATTDAHKVPETVLSRCEVHTFKKPSVETLAKTVATISKKEGYTLPTEAARLIALLGEGSFRDTIGILQKVLNASKDKKISAEEVAIITGAPRQELMREIILAMADNNLDQALKSARAATLANVEQKVLLKMLMEEIRLVMLALFAPALASELKTEVGEEGWQFIEEVKLKPGAKRFPAVLRELLDTYQTIGRAAVPELPLELSLIKILGSDKVE